MGLHLIIGQEHIKGTDDENLLRDVLESKSLEPIIKNSKKLDMSNPVFTEPLGRELGIVYFLTLQSEIVYVGVTNKKKRILQHLEKGEKEFDGVIYNTFKGYINWVIESRILKNFKFKYNNCVVSKKLKNEK